MWPVDGLPVDGFGENRLGHAERSTPAVSGSALDSPTKP
jgi:hypothetical protein